MEWACDATLTGPLTHSDRLVLITMAKYAQPDGSRVFCGRAKIGSHTGLSVRSVSRALASLMASGHISYGDQQYVAHHPAWARPVVYDVAIGRPYEDYSDPVTAPVTEPHPLSPVTPPVTSDTPCHQCHPVTHTVTPPVTSGTYPLSPVTTKPKTEPTTEQLQSPPQVLPWCRRCDEVHRTSQQCPDKATNHDAGAASVRAAMSKSRLDARATRHTPEPKVKVRT